MRLGFAVIVAVLLFAAPARATVIPVDTFVDPLNPMTCSLRDALDAANGNAPVDTCPAGDLSATDTIQLPAGPYVLANGAAHENANATGDLDALAAGGPLVIAGAGAATTSISAAGITGGDRVLDVLAGATVTISGVTLKGGAPPGEDGGALRSAGTLTLVDAVVTGNRAADGTAAMSGGATGGPGHDGGGIISDGTLVLVRTTVSDNAAGAGGRGFDAPGVNGSDAGDGGSGGGIFNAGVLTLGRSLILRNHAGAGGRGGDGSIGGAAGDGGDGGGLLATSPLTMTATLVAGNTAGAGGAGGNADSGQGGAGGNGGDGGGLGATGANSFITLSTLTGNAAGAAGPGGAFISPPSVPGAAGAGNALTAGAQTRLVGTIADGACAGAPADGGNNLGGAGCPGSHAAPRLSAAGVPLAGSPAIDTGPPGFCPTPDLAGAARPQGYGCDIGAYEVAAGTLAFTPSALTFAATRVGGSRRRAVTVTNTGLAGLELPLVDVAGAPHFRRGAVTCGLPVLGLSRCSVTVAFTPKRTGARTGTLRIGSQAFALRGQGIHQCVVPKLKGKTVKQARKKLRKAHCTLGKVVHRGHGRPGRVRSSKPKAGAKRPTGTRIRVVVNRRRAT